MTNKLSSIYDIIILPSNNLIKFYERDLSLKAILVI